MMYCSAMATSFTALLLLATTNGAPVMVSPTEGHSLPQQSRSHTARTERLGGQDRYGTAIAVTKSLYQDNTVDVVYVASGENYPDAISVTSLTAIASNSKRVAATVLSPKAGLTPEVLGEIKRLIKPEGKVKLIGGPQALSPEVEEQIKKLIPNAQPKRIAGPTRVETALAIADEINAVAPVQEVMITPADNYGVSMAASAFGAKRHLVHLVAPSTPDGSLHPGVAHWLDKAKIKHITVIGQDSFLSAISHPNVERINAMNPASLQGLGCPKDSTECTVQLAPPPSPAQAIAEKLIHTEFADARNAVLVSLNSAVDGLAAGQLAANKGAPILPIKTDATGHERYGALLRMVTTQSQVTLWAVGGEQVISATHVNEIANAFNQ